MIYILYILIILLLLTSFFFIFKTVIIAITSFTDVPYLPTPRRYLEKTLETLELHNGDNVVDIGSGGGRFVMYAARKYPHIQFTGVEKNIVLVLWSRFVAWIFGIKNATFICSDALTLSYENYNKIYMYLVPTFIDTVMEHISKTLPSNAIVVSFHFEIGYIFPKTHQIKKYPVKYGEKSENIFKWIKK